MGSYLDSTIAYTLYKDETVKPYFVDKTGLLEELIPLVNQGSSYVCITRPRRFGKTVMANMIASFFSRVCDASGIFDSLRIAACESYYSNLNKYPVIHISFNELPRKCKTYDQYIERIERKLIKDLVRSYPDLMTDETEAVWDILSDINLREPDVRFVFVLDEWDYIFHRDFISEQDKMAYLEFLSNLLKGKAYVALAYMTGILPIAKYSSGSELNMFLEYTMASEEKFSDAFGFTDTEVDTLYQRYILSCATPKVTREGLQIWYDGYHTRSGERVYNPRSVVASLQNNNLGNYWTSSGPYDEIYYYIEKNVDDVRDDLALMVSGKPVAVKVREYAATAMNLSTKDEIFSAMVVYGFLSYENGYAFIPNKELM
ncbi:MAG: AAA family ATPase, partial [Lachnospiraceae bacterium]|nr:AAA family ATPase [Lachnospiraceae bacterium]